MQSFNPKNGQIYTETTSSRVRSMVPTWKKHSTGRRANPQAYRNGAKGSSTLRDMAMRSCCWNVDLFMPEALADPGWHYAGMIHRHLKTTDTLTFSAWTLFQQAYPNQPELSHHFRLGHLDSTTSWSSIVKSLSVLSSSVLTRFCAYGLNLDLSQLMSLTDIPTLAALVHVNPAQRNSNALSKLDIRNWCRAVREKKAFQKLKLLFLSSMSGINVGVVLDDFSNFPALMLVGISCRATGSTDLSKTYGWWVRPGSTDADDLSKTMWGSQYSIAEKTERLYEYTTSLPKREADGPVLLSLTCVAAEPSLRNESISWFIRDHVSMETQPKRFQDAQTLQNESEQGTKKRKIRREKQQDVGSLLGTFS